MERYYSDTLCQGLRLLYFQSDPSQFAEGVQLLETAVANEEPHAFYFLARCYGWGDGNVTSNEKKAKKLSKRGIELGSSLCVLGADRMDILKGDVKNAMTGTLEDAFNDVMSMAESGEPMAQYAIGLFYFWGDMLLNFQKPSREDFAKYEKENAAQALKWFRLSAAQGCLPSFRNAFNSVRNGVNGVTKDLEEALRWAETMDGKVDMRDYYHSFILEYQGLKRHADAIRWCERGVRDGVSVCIVDLGLVYLYGDRGAKEDDAKALQLFNMAADAGDAYGCYNAGRCYYNGWGCATDYNEAFRCFDQAYQRGHQAVKSYLAQCYFWGRGTLVNYEMAVRMMNRLISENQDYPKELMGYCCLYGQGISADMIRGKRLLEEAAQANNGQAWMFLGDMYDKAVGVAEDISMAVSCYQKAADKKIPGASEALGRYKKTLFGKWKRR
ncbi:tetratricopeptide repeat protein [Parablautia muri]|uniref:Sel1 repeat family protein n=1 Tax=Parablautia muri TaxID=2320879 RepID=A0A9X5BH82_9FIRM|nr:SEL1-like repeat protein [Parablautia muri]NBJ92887.1 sel1 repeat family protein [Parablautia muri]